MQKLVTFLIFLLIVALVAVVTIPQWAIKEPDEILIGHFPDVPNCWLYFGLEQGLFEKYKLDPQLVEFFSYDEALDSLLNGQIDCFFSFPWSFLLKNAKNIANRIEVIASFYSTSDTPYGALIVLEKSKVKSLKRLRKKKVGVSVYPHEGLDILLRRVLEQEISKKWVRVEQVEKSEIYSLLENKELTGALLYEPELTKILDRGDTRILEEDPISAYLENPYPLYASCISTSFLTEKTEAALNFRSALEESFGFGELNEVDMRNSLPNYIKLSSSQSRKVRLPSFQNFEEIDPIPIQNFADLLFRENILPDSVEIEGLLFKMVE